MYAAMEEELKSDAPSQICEICQGKLMRPSILLRMREVFVQRNIYTDRPSGGSAITFTIHFDIRRKTKAR